MASLKSETQKIETQKNCNCSLQKEKYSKEPTLK